MDTYPEPNFPLTSNKVRALLCVLFNSSWKGQASKQGCHFLPWSFNQSSHWWPLTHKQDPPGLGFSPLHLVILLYSMCPGFSSNRTPFISPVVLINITPTWEKSKIPSLILGKILKTSTSESSCTKSMREQTPQDISQLYLSGHLRPRNYSFAVYRLWTKS